MPNEKNRVPAAVRTFLDAWRALEQACTEEKNCTVQQLEQEIEAAGRASEASRLRMCRQVRNFLVHDSQDFVPASGAMCAFVEDLTKEVRTANGTARDQMVSAASYGQVSIGDTVDKAAMVLLAKKRGDVIVKDTGGCFAGMLGARGFAAALSDPKKLKTVTGVMLDQPPCTVSADDPVSTLPEGRAAVMDGRKCVGMLNPKKGWQQ